MDGNQTCEMIREYLFSLNIDQPIISCVTGHCEQLYVDKAIFSGMNLVLAKPLNVKIVSQLIS
jgi:CheY-like chemotaxis protein